MKNTTQNLLEDITEIITRDRACKVKAASPEIQAAFQVLNAWQGKTEYLLAVKIEQEKLLNRLM